MLSYPSSLQGHSDTPTSITASCLFHQAWFALPWVESHGNAGASGLSLQNLSLHAVSLTPGLLSVQTPFTSWQALAFLLNVESRQISGFIQSGLSLYRTLSAIIVLRQFTKLHYSFYATACNFGKHPWLNTTLWIKYQIAFSVPCRGKFSLNITAQTRPLPTHLKG